MKLFALCLLVVSLLGCGTVSVPEGGLLKDWFKSEPCQEVPAGTIAALAPEPAPPPEQMVLRSIPPRPPVEPKLVEGARQEGTQVFGIGCVTGISNSSLARDIAEGRAHTKIQRFLCSSNTATIYGSKITNATTQAGMFCVEVSSTVQGVHCN